MYHALLMYVCMYVSFISANMPYKKTRYKSTENDIVLKKKKKNKLRKTMIQIITSTDPVPSIIAG